MADVKLTFDMVNKVNEFVMLCQHLVMFSKLLLVSLTIRVLCQMDVVLPTRNVTSIRLCD